MKKVRFAICGAGRRGGSLTKDLLTLDAVEIVAVCDVSLEKAEGLANFIKEKKR